MYLMPRNTKDESDFRISYPSLSPVSKGILEGKGLEDRKDIEKFIYPDYERDTHDPYLLSDMEKAVQRILKALKKKEKIVLYADYDADGIPSAVLFSDFLKKVGQTDFDVYIPHRHREGFGLNSEAVRSFGKNGVNLIITLDCGSTAIKEVEEAKKLGIDVIITDHHTPKERLPNATAFINPKKPGDKYPFKELCGAGVAFKLVQALETEVRNQALGSDISVPEGWSKWLLDMVAIATLSDVVDLVGENRVLTKYGLKVLRKSRRPGLRELLRKINIKQRHITEDDVVFMITPRINAASRMDRPEDAYLLLSAEDEIEAKTYAEHLNKINNKRKAAVALMVKDAFKRLKSRSDLKDVIVIGDPHWKPGLAGLAAQRIAEAHGRPAFVWGKEGSEVIRGSCRSENGVNVLSIMKESQEHFIEFGGHQFSGGFSLSHENVHTLEEKLQESIEATKANDVVEGSDEERFFVEVSLSDLNESLWEELELFAPFGKGNPKPEFLLKDIQIENVKHFGKDKNHLEIQVGDGEGKMKAISFFTTSEDYGIKEGDRVDMKATMEKSYFGRPELRLRIVDIV